MGEVQDFMEYSKIKSIVTRHKSPQSVAIDFTIAVIKFNSSCNEGGEHNTTSDLDLLSTSIFYKDEVKNVFNAIFHPSR